MKIDKFDYKQTKDIILNTISELDDEGEISTGNFQFGYYKNKLAYIREDIKVVENKLKEQGIDLYKFIKKYEKEVFDDSDFVSHDAFMDTLLYVYDKEKSILSGALMSDGDDKEYFVKYNYGYYTYDMGKRYLLQTYKTLNDYYKDTAENILYGYLNSYFGCSHDTIERCSVIKKYGDGYTIYAHLRALYYEMKVDDKYDNFVDEIDSDFKDIQHKIDHDILYIYINNDSHIITNSEAKEIKNNLDVAYQTSKYGL